MPFPRFLRALPPDPGVRPVSPTALAPWRENLPPELLEFYTEVGAGSFGGGLFFVQTPDRLQGLLDLWLNPSPRRIPFARDAFGDLFYYRDLREEARARGMTGENPGELGDVSWVEVHYARVEVAALSIPELFEEILGDEDLLDPLLRVPLARKALEILGPLRDDEQLGFVPALALGGAEDLSMVQKVVMRVHSSLLRQLV